MRSTLFLTSAVALLATDCAARISGYVDASSADLQQVLRQNYTYIVVGGGNTGLVVASRLSEDARKTVLVIEAGKSARETSGVIVPGLSGSTFLSEVDWAFFTTPQANAHNRSVYWPRGKMLGGSSGLNFLAATRPTKSDIAAIAAAAGDGFWDWNWGSWLPWFQRSEQYTSPGPTNQNVTRTDSPWVHGRAKVGVSVSYPPFLSDQFVGFQEGLSELGLGRDVDWSDGAGTGWGYSASTIDPVSRNRDTSDTAFIAPIISQRSNLVVLSSAQALKLRFASKKDKNGNLVATGVDFVSLSEKKKVYTATATAEVILSAGSIKSPQLLELSGVGDSKVLSKAGVKTLVDLKGVGANLQDHPGVVVVYELNDNYTSLDGLAGDRLNAALGAFAKGDGILTQELSLLAYLSPWQYLSPSELIKATKLALTPNSALPARHQAIQVASIGAGTPTMEILPINVYFAENPAGDKNVSYISLAACLQQSLSRGTIHITSADPFKSPAIDPAYLQHPFDTFHLAKAAQYLRKLATETSFAKFVLKEAEPGFEVQTDEDWTAFVRSSVRTEYHPASTLSMGSSPSTGGVVSPKLIVYGTANVRVADLSVIPVHVSTHPQMFLYSLGEPGLVVASRLAANLSRSVLVIEAGPHVPPGTDPRVDIPGFCGSTIGSELDYKFVTVPQTIAGGRVLSWPRGKILGGSSALNFLVSVRGWAQEFNWTPLGATGWNWGTLLPYFKRSQTFHAPGGNSAGELVDYDVTVQGSSGPVDISYPPFLPPQIAGWYHAVGSLGIPVAKDQGNGKPVGRSYAPTTVEPSAQRRRTSQAYLDNAALQPNLVILSNARATRINFSPTLAGSNVVAESVSFVAELIRGPPINVTAAQVILSAGTIASPQLLELSGVGNPAVMNPLGIPTVVNLPGVGENLQDHPMVLNIYRLKEGYVSADAMFSDPVQLAAAFAQYALGQGPLTYFASPLAYISAPQLLNVTERQMVQGMHTTAKNPFTPPPQLSQELSNFVANVPVVEVLPANAYFGSGAEPGSSYISLAGALQHSLSRGTVHIASNDVFNQPKIDPKYLQSPVDQFLLTRTAIFNRKIAETPELAAFIEEEVQPGPSVSTIAQMDAWVKQNVASEFHPVGTCKIGARSDKGVVDSNLLVYGTQNVHVVDASIMPMHVSAHLQAVVYAIAERAADLLAGI